MKIHNLNILLSQRLLCYFVHTNYILFPYCFVHWPLQFIRQDKELGCKTLVRQPSVRQRKAISCVGKPSLETLDKAAVPISLPCRRPGRRGLRSCPHLTVFGFHSLCHSKSLKLHHHRDPGRDGLGLPEITTQLTM